MATIRLAYDEHAYVPIHGMSRAAFIAAMNTGIQYALSRGPQCYAKEANLTFTGINNGWDIIFSGKAIKNAWASARIDGWGRGVVYWSTDRTTLARWNKWPTESIQGMVTNLVGHECGHILLYTRDQSVGIPLTSAMRIRLRSHWGSPTVREGDRIDKSDAEPSSQSLWSRVRGYFSEEHVLTFEELDQIQSKGKSELGAR